MGRLVSEAAPAHAGAPGNVRSRAIGGASWTIGGYAAQQILRLGSNLILTRLLAPEVFGLMSLVLVFVTGLELLSDIGVGPAIIQSRRGDDPRLLDTAWTVQIIRGFILLLMSAVVAWPTARIYAEPSLLALVPAAGLGIAIRGFTPTRVHTLNRKVLLGRLTVMELISQAAATIVTVVTAIWVRSAWALIIGTVFGDAVRVVLGFVMLPGHRHRFAIERASVEEIVHVGRWVFVSTAVTFAVGHLDRLTMGRLLTVSDLGVYSIAFLLCNAVVALGRTVGARVLFPLLAETVRDSPERLYRRLRTARAVWLLPTGAALVTLVMLGDWTVRLLYSRAYAEAGWMLRFLAAGSIAAVVNQASGIIWPALGEFRTVTLLLVVQVPVMFGCMLLGHHWYGLPGFVFGAAVVELLVYPLQAFLLARRKLWQPELDLPVLVVGAAALAVAVSLR